MFPRGIWENTKIQFLLLIKRLVHAKNKLIQTGAAEPRGRRGGRTRGQEGRSNQGAGGAVVLNIGIGGIAPPILDDDQRIYFEIFVACKYK